jgi:hypothetical protein
LKEIAIEVSDSGSLASMQLLKILSSGGKITKAPSEMSIMLNGLRYYCMEVTMDSESYIIQGFEKEAVLLYNNAMSFLADKNRF